MTQVVALADALAAPIVHALRGKEHVEWDNPFDVGMTGLIGFSSGYHAMNELRHAADAGHRLPLSAISIPTNAKIVQVDIRPRRSAAGPGRPRPSSATSATTIEALLPRLRRKEDSGFLDAAKAHYAKARADLDDLADGEAGRQPNPSAVSRPAGERDRRRRCDLHRRRRHAHRLGGALSDHERHGAG